MLAVALVKTPSVSENDLAGTIPTEGSGTLIPTLVVSGALTPAFAAALAPLFAFAAANSAARYLAKDFQGILKTILEARALAPQQEGLCKRPLKAQAPDLYCNKTYMECYNSCRQCEDHFATAGATGLNGILFAATFLKDQALFR